MRDQILQILKGYPGVKAEQVGKFWKVSVGPYGGARENGVSLAHDLKAQYDYQQDEYNRHQSAAVPPQPLTTPLAPVTPATDYEAIIAELKAQLAQALAPEPLEADDLPIPEFLKAPEPPPPDLADLIEYADTPAETNEKLLVRLREVMGLIGLAEDDGRRASAELYRRKDRLESGIRWNRGRLAGTI
jgi:hypothetical protein